MSFLKKVTAISTPEPTGHVLHIVAGTEDWEPTEEELNHLTQMFLEAEQSPNGGIVATRTGVRAYYVK